MTPLAAPEVHAALKTAKTKAGAFSLPSASISRNFPAGIGRPKSQPWARMRLSVEAKYCAYSSVSMPSTTISRSSASAIARICGTMLTATEPVPIACVKTLSILVASTDRS